MSEKKKTQRSFAQIQLITVQFCQGCFFLFLFKILGFIQRDEKKKTVDRESHSVLARNTNERSRLRSS